MRRSITAARSCRSLSNANHTFGIGTAFFLCVLALPGFAQVSKSQEKFATTVHLSISYNADATVKAQIISFFSRELRSLGDVTVVDEKGHYIISAVGVPLRAGGKTNGFALAIVFLRQPQEAEWATDRWFHDMIGVEQVIPKRLDILRALLQHGPEYLDSYLETGPFDSLQNICQKVVALLDTNILDGARKEWNAVFRPANND